MLPCAGNNSRHAPSHVCKQRSNFLTDDHRDVTSDVYARIGHKPEEFDCCGLKKKMGKLFCLNGPSVANSLTSHSNVNIKDIENSLKNNLNINFGCSMNNKTNMEYNQHGTSWPITDAYKYGPMFHAAVKPGPSCLYINSQRGPKIHQKGLGNNRCSSDVGVKFFSNSNSYSKKNFSKKREDKHNFQKKRIVREFIDTDWRAGRKNNDVGSVKSNDRSIDLRNYQNSNDHVHSEDVDSMRTVETQQNCTSSYFDGCDRGSDQTLTEKQKAVDIKNSEKKDVCIGDLCTDKHDRTQVIDWFDISTNDAKEKSSNVEYLSVDFSVGSEELVSAISDNSSTCTIHREESVCSDILEQCEEKTLPQEDITLAVDGDINVKILDTDNQTNFNKERCSDANVTVNKPLKNESRTCSDPGSDEKYSRQYILYIRKENKKCRPSSKKRQRKSQKDVKCQNSERKETKDNSTGKQKLDCSKNKFVILSYNHPENISTKEKQYHHSFIFMCDDEDSDADCDFSTDESESDHDDLGDEICASFSSPLSLNVLIQCRNTNPAPQEHMTDNQKTDKNTTEESDIVKAANLQWEKHINTFEKKSKSLNSVKKVHFPAEDKMQQVHPMITWSFAYHQARIGDWKQTYLDRERFQKRVEELEKILAPCFSDEKRAQVYSSLHKCDK